jgi:hypothetical protein
LLAGGLLARERIGPMSEITNELELIAEESLIHQISDEALEAAADVKDKALNYTFGACTGLSVCPA